jgi:hypothetical protein
MAIQNASDLLVYKKTSPARAQVTRIKVKSSTPIKDFTAGDNIILNNVTDASGDVSDGVVDALSGVNSGFSVCSSISAVLTGTYGYTATGVVNDPNDASFKKIDVTNGANGPVPTLEVLSGTNEFKSGAVEIVVITSGQSLVYQPIAFSTSASLGVSKDLRDITTKDSQGWQENAKGLGSFELSTDALWDVNNAVGVESATEDLIQGDLVDVKFSDRVRNLIDTEEVYGDGWSASNVTLTKHLEDPFSQFTAAQVDVSSNGASRNYRYGVPIQLVEGKKVTWTLYLKAFSATANSCKLKIILNSDSGTDLNASTSIEKISGVGTVSSPSVNFKKVTGVSTTSWTKVKITTDSVVSGADLRDVWLLIYPGADHNNQTTADKIITASWQIETGTSASDYQNPTEVDCYQGKAFVNSVSVDAGVEDNATYSASFTGTSELFVNGLGHELLGDNYFDGTETTVGLDKFLVPNWKFFNSSSNSQNSFPGGSAKFKWITSGSGGYLTSHNGTTSVNPMVVGKEYELTYTVSNYVNGSLKLLSTAGDPTIPLTVATHKIRFTADLTYLRIEKGSESNGEISISYISLKEVFS